jgi:hypothetical protein
MFFTNVIVNLDYGKNDLNEIISNSFGLPLSKITEKPSDSMVYIAHVKDSLSVVNPHKAKKILAKNRGSIYAITQEEYLNLTTDSVDADNKLHKAKLSAKVNDKFSEKLSSIFVSDMAKVVALLLTAWLMPFISLITVPFIFSLGYIGFNIFSYRLSYNRWPNKAEMLAILERTLDVALALITTLLLYTLISGASLLAPLAIHALSIGSINFGGPLFTYLIAPLAIATFVATGVSVYHLSKVLLTHFIEMKLTLIPKFPYFFRINIRKDRDSIKQLFSKLLITTFKEFTQTFITVLASVYLSYIPGGLIAGYLLGATASSAATTLFSVATQFAIGLFNTFIVSTLIEKAIAKTLKTATLIKEKYVASQEESATLLENEEQSSSEPAQSTLDLHRTNALNQNNWDFSPSKDEAINHQAFIGEHRATLFSKKNEPVIYTSDEPSASTNPVLG